MFFTQGQFWPSGIVILRASVCVCLSVCQSLTCPHDNSGPVQAVITKFVPKMQNAYCFVDWSTLTFKVKFNLKVQIYPILSLSAPYLITHWS